MILNSYQLLNNIKSDINSYSHYSVENSKAYKIKFGFTICLIIILLFLSKLPKESYLMLYYNIPMPYYVYILLCSDKSLYTGIARDPDKRFIEHVNGRGGRYTRSHPPIKIIYQKKMGSKSEALKRELHIKRWSRSEKIQKLHLTSIC